jgi:hypothetical protein
MSAQDLLIKRVEEDLLAHGWTNIEVDRSSRMFVVVKAESEPGQVFLNSLISIYVGPRSIRGGHVFPFGKSVEIPSGRWSWRSYVSTYGRIHA